MRRPRRRGRIIAASLGSALAARYSGGARSSSSTSSPAAAPPKPPAARPSTRTAPHPATPRRPPRVAGMPPSAKGTLPRGQREGRGRPRTAEARRDRRQRLQRHLAQRPGQGHRRRAEEARLQDRQGRQRARGVRQEGQEGPACSLGAPGSTVSDRLQVLGTQLENTETRYDERNGQGCRSRHRQRFRAPDEGKGGQGPDRPGRAAPRPPRPRKVCAGRRPPPARDSRRVLATVPARHRRYPAVPYIRSPASPSPGTM